MKVKHIKEITPLKNELTEKKAHLKTLESAEKPDKDAINKTIDEIYLLKAEVTKKQSAFRQDVRKLLNDEQKIIFDMHQSKGMGKCKSKGNGKCQGMGNDPCCGQGSNMGCGMGQGKGGANEVGLQRTRAGQARP